MRKKLTQHITIAMAAVMVLATAAGCKKDDADGSLFVPPEYVYVAQSVPLPDNVGDVQSLAYADGKVFFVAYAMEYDEETFTYTYNYNIYSMNIDGTELTQLPNYSPPIEVPDGASGGVNINTLKLDSDGSIWIIERYDFYCYDLPDDFDYENDMPWDYYESLGTGTAVRKLDSMGAELLSIDLDSALGSTMNHWGGGFGIDGSGNIYIFVDDYERGGRTIYALDSDGNKHFELSTDSWFNEFICLSDGSIGFAAEKYDETGFRRVLQSIDFSAKALGSSIDLPNVGWEVYSGSGEFDVLIGDSSNIFGYTAGEDEAVKLLNWLESDIIGNDIRNVVMLPDGRVLCTNRTYSSKEDLSVSEILILTKTPYAELAEKTVLTFATLYVPQQIGEAVVMFNRSSPDYRIRVIDYSEFNSEDDWNAGLTRLTAEITAGRVPDILNVTGLLYDEYAGKGLLADLYQFIDSDPAFSRSDFIQGPFKAAEIDGCLYQLFPSFYVQTLLGNPAVVGEGMGWSMDEFTAVLRAHPEADVPLGQWLSKTTFLQASISLTIDNYIDWAAGTASFDSPEFIALLESASAFPDDPDWSNMGMANWDDIYIPEDEAIATGRQIMAQSTLYSFAFYQYYKMIFGGEIVFKGFPNETGVGNSLVTNSGLAITESSAHKEAAWAFVRTILEEDWQIENTWWGFPTNRAAFDHVANEAMTMEKGSHSVNNIDIEPATQADVDAVLALIASAQGTAGWNIDQTVWDIISEGISDYFNGVSSAQDVARVIQSRVSILVSERS